MESVCRTCLQIIGCSQPSSCLSQLELRQKLEACVPELTVDIVLDPRLCGTCSAALTLSYQFKATCLETEKMLYSFIQSRTRTADFTDLLNTSDLLRLTRKTITDEHNYSFMESDLSSSNGVSPDSEGENEHTQGTLPKVVQTFFGGLVDQAVIIRSEEVKASSEMEVAGTSANVDGKRGVKRALTKENKLDVSETKPDSSSRLLAKRSSANADKKVVGEGATKLSARESSSDSLQSKDSIMEAIGDVIRKCQTDFSDTDSLESVKSFRTSSSNPLEPTNKVTPKKTSPGTPNKKGNHKQPEQVSDLLETNATLEIAECPSLLSKDSSKKVDDRAKNVDEENNGSQAKTVGSTTKTGQEITISSILANDYSVENHKRSKKLLNPDTQEKSIEEVLQQMHEEPESGKENGLVDLQTEKISSQTKKPAHIDVPMSRRKQNVSKKRLKSQQKANILSKRRIMRKRPSSSRVTKRVVSRKSPRTRVGQRRNLRSNKEAQSKTQTNINKSDSNDSKAVNIKTEKDIPQMDDLFMFSNSLEFDDDEPKRYRCTKCSKGYNYKSHFDTHLKSHIFKKLYSCPLCDKSFSQEKYLHSHSLLHTGSGMYQCPTCKRYLSSSSALKRHLRTHTGEKPYSCSTCEKRFTQKIQLAVHMRVHTGFRPFVCNICSGSFSQKSHLLGHIRIHTGEKPYACSQCPKRFRKNFALRIHKQCHVQKPFQCRLCNHLFKDEDVFERHINKHVKRQMRFQNEQVETPKSGLPAELEQDLKDINASINFNEQMFAEHGIKEYALKTNPFSCKICNRGFSTKFSRNRHMKIHVTSII